MKLQRTKQCKSCPWKTSTNPLTDIPNYDIELHRNLANTIANGSCNLHQCELRVMNCHCHTDDNPAYCVGWLMHQLNQGNNIAMRLKMMQCENANELETFGEQHETFEDTIPKL